MSLPQELEITCPHCESEQKTTVWRTINTTIDPELKQNLLDGQINMFRCPDCDYEGHVDLDLLYHDMRQEFLVQYYPFYWLDEADLLEEFTPEGEWRTDSEIERTEYIFRPPHVVFDMGELVRYIIFRDRLYEQCR